jgi:hypothetical protein
VTAAPGERTVAIMRLRSLRPSDAHGEPPEFAARDLRLSATTRETACIACGDPACRVEVAVARVVDGRG